MKKNEHDLRTISGKSKLLQVFAKLLDAPIAPALGVEIAGEIWFDTHDMMQLMHTCAKTLYNWRKQGLLPYGKPYEKSRKIYYRESDVAEMLKKRHAA
jgi:hypothetical protein